MIVFDLKCENGHRFEEWFASSAEYEDRQAAHALACPTCGDTHVDKALMAPRVNGGGAAAEPSTPCGMPACAAGGCQMLGR
jgi:hypothetical protein